MASKAAPLPTSNEVPQQMGFDRLAEVLSSRISKMRQKIYAPDARKQLRKFSSGEASKLLGISDSHLRQLSIDGIGPQPELGAGSISPERVPRTRFRCSHVVGRGRSCK